jgi:Cysteine-rich CWC
MRGPISKICDHCKQVFECGQYSCWCGKIGVTEAQMDWITARFEDCLCSECLGQVARGEVESLKRSFAS